MARNSLIGLTDKSGRGLRVPGRNRQNRLDLFPAKKRYSESLFQRCLQFGVVVEGAFQSYVNGYGLRRASSPRRGFQRGRLLLRRRSQQGWSGG